jgi:hypothetical protein
MKWSRKHRRHDRGEVETRIEFADGKELPAAAELVPRSLFARVHLDEQPWAGSDAIPAGPMCQTAFGLTARRSCF